MVRFEKVVKKYDDGHVAVKEVDLHVKAGEFICFIGPSGCGKTTTLKMVNRLITPTDGTVYVNGEDIMKVKPVELRRKIGYVIQQIGLFPHMTIRENIEVVPRLLGWSKSKRENRVNELLQLVNMDPEIYAERYPNELSGGQQQRIGVLRALAVEPPLILMDEPFGALDPITRESLQDEFKRLQRKLKKTILFVTHDMEEALKLADRIVIMKDGEIVQAASPEELLRKPANEFVSSFIGKHRLESGLDSVSDIMVKPITVYPHTGIAESVHLMRRHRVNSLIVVDEDNRIQGRVTVDRLQDKPKGKSIADVLEPIVPTIPRGASAKEAFDQIKEGRMDFLAVVDGKKLVGLVTRTSMVDALASVVWGEDEE